MGNPLQTKQLAARLNVAPSQIVKWAVAGLLPAIEESIGSGNSRLYSPEIIERGRLLCRLTEAGIRMRDIRKLIPIIESALAEDIVLSVPYPVKVGERLYTLCQIPMQGPALVEGIPPGQTVIPLLVLEGMTQAERIQAAADK
jgi:DNA-binding transcriptional MerR regulator